MSNGGPSPKILPVSPSFDELRAIERADLNERRSQLGRRALSRDADPSAERVAGLALSGGGVRSAALSLGAIEALSTVMLPEERSTSSAPTIFNQIDYVSSVSGGSYAACSISAKIFRDNATSALSPKRDHFASSYLTFVRTHSKLLDDYFEILTNWMYGFLVGVLTILPFLLVIAAAEVALIRDDKGLADAMSFFSDRWRYALISGGLVYLLFAVISSSQITDRKAVERLWKLLLLLLIAAWFVGLQPILVYSNLPSGYFHEFLRLTPLTDAVLRTEAQEVLIPGVMLLLLAAILISLLLRREQFLRDTISTARALLYGVAIQLCLAAIFVSAPMFIWSMVLLLSRWGVVYRQCYEKAANHCAPEWIVFMVRKLNDWLAPLYRYFEIEGFFKEYGIGIVPGFSFSVFYVLVAVILFATMKYVIDSNSSSFHRFYSDRLRGSFFNHPSAPDGQRQIVPLISELGGTVCPYLLVNCALNANVGKGKLLKTADEPFVIASRYTGNDAAQYMRTDVLERATGSKFDLASIAAVSGAAFAPVMGRYTIPAFRLLMSMLALRLGYWIPNPRQVTKFDPVAKGISPVGRRVDGLYFLREMFGWLSVKTRFLYITDGGHADNSGIYELLRRRCSTIIAVDAEPDSENLFENIAYLIEFARARLNVEIELKCHTVGAAGGTHCAIGRIKYPSSDKLKAFEGRLVFIKLSLTGDENWDLLCRRNASGEFPYHSTINQNYDELLFNAYRTLGIHMVSRVFDRRDRVEFWDGNVRPLSTDEVRYLFEVPIDSIPSEDVPLALSQLFAPPQAE